MIDAPLTLGSAWRSCVTAPYSAAAWDTLLQHHGKLFAAITVRVARRFGPCSRAEHDDALQEACLRLSQHARTGKVPAGADSLVEPYLKAVIANAVHDYFRARKALCRNDDILVPLDEIVPPSSANTADRRLLIQELEDLTEPRSRERLLFQLYFREGWTAQEIAGMPTLQLSVKGVETAIGRIVAGLRDRIKRSGSQRK